MAAINDNITKFNEYVKTQREMLEARGEETKELLVNLFKGYKNVTNRHVTTYIETKEDKYNEGKDIDADTLMELAESKYRTLVESERWKEPTKEEKKIVALTAELTQLKKKKTNNKGKKEKDKDNQTKMNQKKKEPWYLMTPKEGEPHTKMVKNKEYHWCPNHATNGKWVRHKPSE